MGLKHEDVASKLAGLLAETGGKSATIVTAMADRDQAITCASLHLVMAGEMLRYLASVVGRRGFSRRGFPATLVDGKVCV